MEAPRGRADSTPPHRLGPGLTLKNFTVEALDPTDIVVSKLKRLNQNDIDDIKALADKKILDHKKLLSRFESAVDRFSADIRQSRHPRHPCQSLQGRAGRRRPAAAENYSRTQADAASVRGRRGFAAGGRSVRGAVSHSAQALAGGLLEGGRRRASLVENHPLSG